MRRSALHDELESFARAESNRRAEVVRAADRFAAQETQPATSDVMWIPYGPAEEAHCVQIAADIDSAEAALRAAVPTARYVFLEPDIDRGAEATSETDVGAGS